MHPAYNGQNYDEIAKDKSPQVGIYFLSKFRGLHNHPLELSYIYAGYGGTDGKEREVLGRYESDALDELLSIYESKKFERVGERYVLRMKSAIHDIYILNPEAGIPSIV